jgi:putative oxidoreductase
MRLKDWLLEIFTYLLALLFFYTALSKIIDFKRFVWEIGNQPFEHWLRPILIYGLPTIELIVVYLLLNLKTRQQGFYLSSVLMFIFTIYVAMVTVNYYNRVPCSCAGVFHAMSWQQHLIFNIFFTIVAIIGIVLNSSKSKNSKNHLNSVGT